MKFSKVTLAKMLIAPWGAHGDVIEVGKNGVTEIETIPGTPNIVVTYVKDKKEQRAAFRDWERAIVAPNEYQCPTCGKELENAQALGKHRTTCGVKDAIQK